jgi:hypothetical protein
MRDVFGNDGEVLPIAQDRITISDITFGPSGVSPSQAPGQERKKAPAVEGWGKLKQSGTEWSVRPCGPYPVLGLMGEQGSGKSSFAKILRSLVDPNTALLRSFPREDRDLFIAASNGWIVGYDNVSAISGWLPTMASTSPPSCSARFPPIGAPRSALRATAWTI